MPVCSYLVFPAGGDVETLTQKLSALPGCEAVPAEDRALVLLVTDTPDQASEDALQEDLRGISEIQCMALTFGQIEDASVGAGVDRNGDGDGDVDERRTPGARPA